MGVAELSDELLLHHLPADGGTFYFSVWFVFHGKTAPSNDYTGRCNIIMSRTVGGSFMMGLHLDM